MNTTWRRGGNLQGIMMNSQRNTLSTCLSDGMEWIDAALCNSYYKRAVFQSNHCTCIFPHADSPCIFVGLEDIPCQGEHGGIHFFETSNHKDNHFGSIIQVDIQLHSRSHQINATGPPWLDIWAMAKVQSHWCQSWADMECPHHRWRDWQAQSQQVSLAKMMWNQDSSSEIYLLHGPNQSPVLILSAWSQRWPKWLCFLEWLPSLSISAYVQRCRIRLIAGCSIHTSMTSVIKIHLGSDNIRQPQIKVQLSITGQIWPAIIQFG